MKEHKLKVWPQYYAAIACGDKLFEVRSNDRKFKVGDVLKLQEWDPGLEKYTGQSIRKTVGYITDFGQAPGIVILGFREKPGRNQVELAAPDLLAIVRRLNAQGGHGIAEHEAMRAAIAKAEGGEG